MTPDAVRRLRKRLGLTQSKFAALLGVHKVTVAVWEAGVKSGREGGMGMSATTERLLRIIAQQGPQALAQPRKSPGTTRRKGR
jgi:DNA-binding transcriptional regulator YiaG